MLASVSCAVVIWLNVHPGANQWNYALCLIVLYPPVSFNGNRVETCFHYMGASILLDMVADSVSIQNLRYICE